MVGAILFYHSAWNKFDRQTCGSIHARLILLYPIDVVRGSNQARAAKNPNKVHRMQSRRWARTREVQIWAHPAAQSGGKLQQFIVAGETMRQFPDSPLASGPSLVGGARRRARERKRHSWLPFAEPTGRLGPSLARVGRSRSCLALRLSKWANKEASGP